MIVIEGYQTVFTETGHFEISLTGVECFSIDCNDGFHYIAVSSLGMKDKCARILRESFNQCWREVFKAENLNAKEVSKAWREFKQSGKGNNKKDEG